MDARTSHFLRASLLYLSTVVSGMDTVAGAVLEFQSRIPPIGPPRLTATEPAIEGREERCALEGGAFSSFGNAN